jgi:hypothetical protein
MPLDLSANELEQCSYDERTHRTNFTRFGSDKLDAAIAALRERGDQKNSYHCLHGDAGIRGGPVATRVWLQATTGIASCIISACADIRGQTANLTPLVDGAAPSHIVVARDIKIELSTGYSRTLHQGTVWVAAGSIAQGAVYKPRDTVFSVEGTNVHEAYLVLSDGKLVGYYLPAERSYVAQPSPIDIPTQ